jgi:hypothetical protein
VRNLPFGAAGMVTYLILERGVVSDEQPGMAPAMADDDEFVPNAEHRALWARADSLEDLGELMARWLEGGISYQPGVFGRRT